MKPKDTDRVRKLFASVLNPSAQMETTATAIACEYSAGKGGNTTRDSTNRPEATNFAASRTELTEPTPFDSHE